MSKKLLLFLFAGIFAAGCSKVTHRKTPGGMPYQLFKGKGGEKIYPGNFIKVHLTQTVKDSLKDSIYFTTRDKMPIYIPVNEAQPYDISETWTKLRVGDSIVAIQMMDTFLKRNPQMPPQFKNGQRIMTYVKILGVVTSDSMRLKDEKKMQDEKLAEEVKFLEKWLKEKNANVQKTKSGAFVEIISPGSGELLDSGKYVTVNYTGTSFSGVRFDSNTDSSFQHVQPYSFTIGNHQMILGFDEAMVFLRKGGSAKVYIPSILGYGAQPSTPLIKPFENLIFDIEVVDVKDKDPNPPMDPRFPNRQPPQQN